MASNNDASNGGGGASSPNRGKHCEVTPAFLRTLMPQGPSAEDVLYKKKQQEVYRMMEMAARQNLYEVAITVYDAEIEDDRMLDNVYERLVRWLTRPKEAKNAFHVRPSSNALRSCVISWDPIETPQSVTNAEASNPQCATHHRLKQHSSLATNHSSYQQQQQQHMPQSTAHLAPPQRASHIGAGHYWSPWVSQVPFGQADWSSQQQQRRQQHSSATTREIDFMSRASASRASMAANSAAGAATPPSSSKNNSARRGGSEDGGATTSSADSAGKQYQTAAVEEENDEY